MSAQPDDEHDFAVVPLPELRRLLEIEAAVTAHDGWVAAGRPGARSHEDVMAELLGA